MYYASAKNTLLFLIILSWCTLNSQQSVSATVVFAQQRRSTRSSLIEADIPVNFQDTGSNTDHRLNNPSELRTISWPGNDEIEEHQRNSPKAQHVKSLRSHHGELPSFYKRRLCTTFQQNVVDIKQSVASLDLSKPSRVCLPYTTPFLGIYAHLQFSLVLTVTD